MMPLTAPAPPRSQAVGFGSQLTQQIQHEKERQQEGPQPSPSASPSGAETGKESSRSSSKSRSLSDAPKPSLSPSPAFREPTRTTKDDISITSSPVTPRRPNFPVRGLSLQMPQGALNGGFPRVPLSPKLDSSQTFGSPGSVLPRRSRGLDFSRACTNLHHSTLAESSPDSSPTITGKGMVIPRKGFMNQSSVLDSPSNSIWSTMANPDRSTALSSSVSSVNMLDSDTDSSDASEGEPMDPSEGGEDAMLTTPQVYKIGNSSSNPFASGPLNSPGGEWMGNYSPASASLLRLQRAKYRNGRSRKSSSSASGNSTKPSPGPLSPPLIKSIEATNGGYFAKEMSKREVQSRRESLSLGTSDLHLSDISDDGEGENESAITGSRSSSGGLPGTPMGEGSRGVIRRAVTRRSNLLPKSKNFARIRAALMEESAPVDSELKREGEVIRQVRESEPVFQTSPALLPTTSNESNETIPEDDVMISDSSAGATTGSTTSFSQHVERNSGGLKFWNQFQEERYRTPPPSLNPRGSSSGISDDLNMDTPPSSFSTTVHPDLMKHHDAHRRSRSSTPVPSVAPTASEVARKANNKRRRDDDFDPASFKRRAVSPGMSVQSSPVMPQSPVFSKDGGGWGHPPPKGPSGHPNVDRSNSGGNSGAPKRVGLQGMTETHDGLMNMSIE